MEKTCSDYLCVAQEAEKEEVMKPPHSQTTDSTSKPKGMSFFPLQKLKGTQPTKTPTVWVAYLEEESTNKEEDTESKDTNGIEGITEEFIVHLVRAVKDAQQEETCCYHCSSPEHLTRDCPLVKASRMDLHLNQKEGTAPQKGAWAPQGKVTMLKAPQDRMPKV